MLDRSGNATQGTALQTSICIGEWIALDNGNGGLVVRAEGTTQNPIRKQVRVVTSAVPMMEVGLHRMYPLRDIAPLRDIRLQRMHIQQALLC